MFRFLKLSVHEVAFVGVFTSLILAVKYAFGYVLGVEFTTLLTVTYAVFLPLHVSLLISCGYVFLTGIIYGFGTWWISYWPIYLSFTIFSWLLKKIVKKNSFLFATWCGFLAFSMIFFFAASDWIIYGLSGAITQIVTGYWVNLIGATSNFLAGLVLLEPLTKLFNKLNKRRNYNEKYKYR